MRTEVRLFQKLMARLGYIRLKDHGLVMTQYGVVSAYPPQLPYVGTPSGYQEALPYAEGGESVPYTQGQRQLARGSEAPPSTISVSDGLSCVGTLVDASEMDEPGDGDETLALGSIIAEPQTLTEEASAHPAHLLVPRPLPPVPDPEAWPSEEFQDWQCKFSDPTRVVDSEPLARSLERECTDTRVDDPGES